MTTVPPSTMAPDKTLHIYKYSKSVVGVFSEEIAAGVAQQRKEPLFLPGFIPLSLQRLYPLYIKRDWIGRMKKLELDPEARERILLGHDGGATGPARSRFPGRRAVGQRNGDEPYYADRAGRLLSVHQQSGRHQRGVEEQGVGSGSPLKSMFGVLSGKLKSVMKNLFQINMFSGEPEDDMVVQNEPEPDGTNLYYFTIS